LARNKKTSKPAVVIAYTTPGKGVSFLENDYRWHGKAPTPQEGAKALEELKREEKMLKEAY